MGGCTSIVLKSELCSCIKCDNDSSSNEAWVDQNRTSSPELISSSTDSSQENVGIGVWTVQSRQPQASRGSQREPLTAGVHRKKESKISTIRKDNRENYKPHSKEIRENIEDETPIIFDITMKSFEYRLRNLSIDHPNNEVFGPVEINNPVFDDLCIRLFMLDKDLNTVTHNSRWDESSWEQTMFDRYCALRGSSIRRPLQNSLLTMRPLSRKMKDIDNAHRHFQMRLKNLSIPIKEIK